MSTPETVVNESPAPAAPSKNKRKKAAKAAEQLPSIEPIERTEPGEIIENPYYPETVIIDEGYSGWTLAKGIVTGVGVGATLMTLLFGYIRAKEIQRMEKEMFIAEMAAAAAAGRPQQAPPLAEPPSSNV